MVVRSSGGRAVKHGSASRARARYNQPAPWNVTYLAPFGGADAGDGYALVVPAAAVQYTASIASTPCATPSGGATLRFAYMGRTLDGGDFAVEYSRGGADEDWTALRRGALSGANVSSSWTAASYALPGGVDELSVRFTCAAGAATSNFCAVDSFVISV